MEKVNFNCSMKWIVLNGKCKNLEETLLIISHAEIGLNLSEHASFQYKLFPDMP